MPIPTHAATVSGALALLLPWEPHDPPSDFVLLSLLSTLVLHSEESVRQIRERAQHLIRLGELVEEEAAKLRPQKQLLRADGKAGNGTTVCRASA